MSAKQEIAARIELSWGGVKLWDSYNQIVRHRDAIAAAIDKLKHSFFEEYEKVTGQELVLDIYSKKDDVWGIRAGKNFLITPDAFERVLPGVMKKLFGRRLNPTEYMDFLRMVTAQFDGEEPDHGDPDQDDDGEDR